MDDRIPRVMAAALAIVALAGTMQPARADLAESYRVIELQLPPTGVCNGQTFYGMYTRRMNERGQLIGIVNCYAETGDPIFPLSLIGGAPFIWSRATGTYEPPALLSGLDTIQGRDINDAGDAVGWGFTPEGYIASVLWPASGGAVLAVPVVGCGSFPNTRVDSINNRGVLLGSARRALDDGTCGSRWVLTRPGEPEVLGPVGTLAQSLNDAEVAVGVSGDRFVRWVPASNAITVLKSAATVDDAAGWFPVMASLNRRGDAVGYFERREAGATVQAKAYLWRANGREVSLGSLDGLPNVAARGISDDGVAVGSVSSVLPPDRILPEISRAVAWKGGKVIDLTARIPARERIQLTDASAIDRRGRIAARGYRMDDVPRPCPVYTLDEQTGEFTFDPSTTCLPQRGFLLIPRD